MRNPGCELDLSWLGKVNVTPESISETVKAVPEEKLRLTEKSKASWLLRAVSCLELTCLNGDDTGKRVSDLCKRAVSPIQRNLLRDLEFENELTTAAVCIYPARVPDAVTALRCIRGGNAIRIATVAAGFPSGQCGIKSKLLEIEYALEKGAQEIDVVINREFVLNGKWKELYDELKQMRAACGQALMKTILSTGELANFDNIYKASLIAMMAGTDFIKTSTGKEMINATLPAGLVIIRAIRTYHYKSRCRIGFKPAGGIRTWEDALSWVILVKRELGTEWMSKENFRIGATSLLEEIEKELFYLAYQKYPEH